jgi:malonyl-CoA/methylmalonyl-CoA synthetase
MHGLGVGINGTLLTGARAVVLERFAPDTVFDAIGRHDATLFFGVPTMHVRLAESPRVAELSRLRLVVSGSAPLPASVWTRLRDAAGIEVLERYGMTETMMLTGNPWHGERIPGTVGMPFPDVELRVSAAGEVEVRGPSVFAGYLGRPDATADAFTADGWFRTGDLGTLDADGRLTLIGRASDLIISAGFNVYPREVEDALRAHDEVLDIAVVGVPDEQWGEVVTACVVLSDAVSGRDRAPDDPARTPVGAREHADGTRGVHPMADDLRAAMTAHAATSLAAYKVPRAWVVVETLPRNAMGKVLRAELIAAVHVMNADHGPSSAATP